MNNKIDNFINWFEIFNQISHAAPGPAHFPIIASELISIFTFEDVDRSLSVCGVGYPALKLLHHSDGMQTPSFAPNLNPLSRLHMPASVLRSFLEGGSSILLTRLHLRHSAIRMLFERVSDINNSVQSIAAILSPPGHQATMPHADDHAVLNIQLYGEKKWFVWGVVPEKEMENCSSVKALEVLFEDAAKSTPFERVMSPGDALYIPKRSLHTAVTHSHFSLSLSVQFEGMRNYGSDRRFDQCLVFTLEG